MKKKITLIIIFILFLFSIYFIYGSFAYKGKNYSKIDFSDIYIQSIDYQKHQLSELYLSDTIVFIYFSTDCNYCNILLDDLYHKKDSIRDYDFILITQDEINQISEYLRKKGNLISNKIYHDIDYSFSSSFFITNTPSLFIVKKDGLIIESQEGYPNIASLKK